MTLMDLLLLLLVIAAAGLFISFVKSRDEGTETPRKAKTWTARKKAQKPLSATRRFAALHQYQVIAPAQIAKDGKFADLDFIIVGWFGLLCVNVWAGRPDLRQPRRPDVAAGGRGKAHLV